MALFRFGARDAQNGFWFFDPGLQVYKFYLAFCFFQAIYSPLFLSKPTSGDEFGSGQQRRLFSHSIRAFSLDTYSDGESPLADIRPFRDGCLLFWSLCSVFLTHESRIQGW